MLAAWVRKWFKRFFWLFVVIAILVVAVITAGHWALNHEHYRAKLNTLLSKAAGQEVQIAGRISPSYKDGKLAIKAGEVSIYNPATRAKWETQSLRFTVPVQKPQNNEMTFNADITGLKRNGFLWGDVQAQIVTNGERVDAKPVTGKILGGDLEGEFHHDKTTWHVEGNLKGFDYGDLIKGASGRADARINLRTVGLDAQTLKKNLNGSVRVMATDGKLPGRTIDLWADDILKRLFPGHDETTQVNCFLAPIDIQNGVAQTESLLLDTRNVTIAAQGQWSIVDNHLDILMKPKPKSASLVSMATPVTISGPIENPSATPSVFSLAKKLGGLIMGVANPAVFAVAFTKLGTIGDKCEAAFAHINQNNVVDQKDVAE